MYIDTSNLGQVALALITLLTAALTFWNNRKIDAVKKATDGMTTAATTAAELAGYSRGAGTTPPPDPRGEQNKPVVP